MLSLLPQLLFLSPFAALLARLALAGVFTYSAWVHCKHKDWFTYSVSAVESIVAISLFLGIWTQAGAIVAALVLIFELYMRDLRVVALGTTLLALVMAVSLILTGAGPLAFDLPL